MVNDSSAAVTTLIETLRSEVRALREEVRASDTARTEAAQAIIAALTKHFDPLHKQTTARISAVEQRVADIEGQLDVVKLMGGGSSDASIPSVFQDIDRAARRANRTGKDQRVNIPDGGHGIIAHIRPGTDAVAVIRSIGSAS